MHLSISLVDSRLFFEHFIRWQPYLLHLQVLAESSPDVIQLGSAAIKHWGGGGEQGWAGWVECSPPSCVLCSPVQSIEGWIYGSCGKIEGTKKCLVCWGEWLYGREKPQTFRFYRLQIVSSVVVAFSIDCWIVLAACFLSGLVANTMRKGLRYKAVLCLCPLLWGERAGRGLGVTVLLKNEHLFLPSLIEMKCCGESKQCLILLLHFIYFYNILA